jgi:hypothetical protein
LVKQKKQEAYLLCFFSYLLFSFFFITGRPVFGQVDSLKVALSNAFDKDKAEILNYLAGHISPSLTVKSIAD